MNRPNKKLVAILITLLFIVILSACKSQKAKEKIIYLDYDENEIAQIYTLEIGTDAAQQLTTSKTNVMEYALAVDGSQIAFVVKERNGGQSIWIMNANGRSPQRIRNCPTATCNRLEWHPDGQRILYEKRPFSTSNRPTIWWVDINSGETVTVLTDPNEISAGTAVSPDGAWLSYISPPTETIQFIHFDNGERFSVPSTIGSPAVWHPDSQQIIVRDNNLTTYHDDEGDDHTEHEHDFSQAVNLFLSSIQAPERQILDATGNIDDGNAAWSPNGEQIAFGRKIARIDTGRQLWLMQADGTNTQALTDDLQIQHGPPKWSANGRFLLHQQADLSQANPQPAIWQYDLETKNLTQITDSGWLPNWLP